MKKRITSIALTLAMVFAMLPALAGNAAAATTARANAESSTVLMGTYYSRAIKADGSLWGWGLIDADSKIYPGNGTMAGSLTRIKIMDNVSQIFGGHSMFIIKTDGSLWSWGNNECGQLGDGTKETRLSPVKIMNDVASILTVGNDISVYAIKTDGSLWAWGDNYGGRLGTGNMNASLTPVKIMDDVLAVSGADSSNILALKSDGSLWGWGSNASGELGDGTTVVRSSPVKIMDGVSQIYGQSALKTDGSLWKWGWNYYGQVGDGTTQTRHTPVKIMDDVVAFTSSKAIKKDGSLWSWGYNVKGEVGDGTTTNRPSPVKIMDNVVSASEMVTNYAIKADGSLWAWGNNSNGTVGDGTTETRPTPVKIMDSVAYASVGYAIKTDGSLWTWGYNGLGGLGDGTTTNRYSPVKIADGVKIPATGTVPTTPAPSPSASTFSDVPATHWAYAAVEKAYTNQLVSGVGNGKFDPERSVSNAEWCMMTSNLLWEDPLTPHNNNVSWWYYAARWNFEMEFLDGTTIAANHTGTTAHFSETDINATINRYDMAQIIYNIAMSDTGVIGVGPVSTSGISSKIADYQSIPSRYRTAVEFCYATGLLTGVDAKGTFSGGSVMTRGAAATILCRLLDVRNGKLGEQGLYPSTTAPQTPANPGAPVADTGDYTQQVFELTNAERAKVGVAALKFNSDLSVIAQARAEALAELGSLPPDHNIPGMGDHNASMRAFGFKGATYAGENLTIASTPSGAITNWLNSTAGHKQNMLGQLSVGSVACTWTDAGIGCAQGANGTYYWVQIFVQ